MCEDICCIKERKTVSTTLNQSSDSSHLSTEQGEKSDTEDNSFNFSFESCFSEFKEKKTLKTAKKLIPKEKETYIEKIEDVIKVEISQYKNMKLIKNSESPLNGGHRIKVPFSIWVSLLENI